jgi:hypothetical protein
MLATAGKLIVWLAKGVVVLVELPELVELAEVIVTTRVAVPVPPALVAPIVSEYVPATVGVPVMPPV